MLERSLFLCHRQTQITYSISIVNCFVSTYVHCTCYTLCWVFVCSFVVCAQQEQPAAQHRHHSEVHRIVLLRFFLLIFILSASPSPSQCSNVQIDIKISALRDRIRVKSKLKRLCCGAPHVTMPSIDSIKSQLCLYYGNNIECLFAFVWRASVVEFPLLVYDFLGCVVIALFLFFLPSLSAGRNVARRMVAFRTHLKDKNESHDPFAYLYLDPRAYSNTF